MQPILISLLPIIVPLALATGGAYLLVRIGKVTRDYATILAIGAFVILYVGYGEIARTTNAPAAAPQAAPAGPKYDPRSAIPNVLGTATSPSPKPTFFWESPEYKMNQLEKKVNDLERAREQEKIQQQFKNYPTTPQYLPLR